MISFVFVSKNILKQKISGKIFINFFDNVSKKNLGMVKIFRKNFYDFLCFCFKKKQNDFIKLTFLQEIVLSDM